MEEELEEVLEDSAREWITHGNHDKCTKTCYGAFRPLFQSELKEVLKNGQQAKLTESDLQAMRDANKQLEDQQKSGQSFRPLTGSELKEALDDRPHRRLTESDIEIMKGISGPKKKPPVPSKDNRPKL